MANEPQSMGDCQAKIRQYIRNLTPYLLKKASQQGVLKRLYKVLEVDGGHIENVL